ncbi:NADP-dependent malic enzyme [Candidatus Providencia siddallii]|uniref:NADP-dependent malic enzyme n=1 Tax=Candidatus Providencia siddallii TaxID=1715285 RepID=A0A0M6W8V8_9GAMM|nr:NADP-dependent malic enzyme [Candidatus Providencia siddallii]
MDDKFKQNALNFHEFPNPGKITVISTKQIRTQYDLSLAYSPGVAIPCLEIANDSLKAYRYTAKGNLVGVISNGSAVLGLGNIGALAGKPVMEGKGILFKKFSGIDVFDIEIDESDPDKLVNIIASLEPTFGAINLEDIKAPECFYIEQKLKDRMNIPVFHDDQHGTAIICTAAIINGLRLVKREISEIKLVVSGAGAASIACINLLVTLGLKHENIIVCDSKGVIYKGRDKNIDATKKTYAIEDKGLRTLADAIPNANVFLGCSAPRLLTTEMVKKMDKNPLILALANPEPEILPSLVKEVRSDAIICTGRSDYPNQVNNVLCFPYIFRGALDVGATVINEEMKLSCVHAIADLALAEKNEKVVFAYEDQDMVFGKNYIIPKPFDPRLILKIAPAVAKAAMMSGVATRPIIDFNDYNDKLNQFVYKTNSIMKSIFLQAKTTKKRIVLAEGEEERVLYATQELISLQLAFPILVGRLNIIKKYIKKLGLHIRLGEDFEVFDCNDISYKRYLKEFYQIIKQKKFLQEKTINFTKNDHTIIAAIMMLHGEADGMICGVVGKYNEHYKIIKCLFGLSEETKTAGTMNVLLLPTGNLFIIDTYINKNPTSKQLAEIVLMAINRICYFGIKPKVSLLSSSSFETSNYTMSQKMRKTLSIIKNRDHRLEINNKISVYSNFIESIHKKVILNNTLKSEGDLLVMPNIEAARICYNLLRITGSDGITIGPILMGIEKPVHILTPDASVRRIINMVAIVAVETQKKNKNLFI